MLPCFRFSWKFQSGLSGYRSFGPDPRPSAPVRLAIVDGLDGRERSSLRP
jgi:hypothetical protein